MSPSSIWGRSKAGSLLYVPLLANQQPQHSCKETSTLYTLGFCRQSPHRTRVGAPVSAPCRGVGCKIQCLGKVGSWRCCYSGVSQLRLVVSGASCGPWLTVLTPSPCSLGSSHRGGHWAVRSILTASGRPSRVSQLRRQQPCFLGTQSTGCAALLVQSRKSLSDSRGRDWHQGLGGKINVRSQNSTWQGRHGFGHLWKTQSSASVVLKSVLAKPSNTQVVFFFPPISFFSIFASWVCFSVHRWGWEKHCPMVQDVMSLKWGQQSLPIFLIIYKMLFIRETSADVTRLQSSNSRLPGRTIYLISQTQIWCGCWFRCLWLGLG